MRCNKISISLVARYTTRDNLVRHKSSRSQREARMCGDLSIKDFSCAPQKAILSLTTIPSPAICLDSQQPNEIL